MGLLCLGRSRLPTAIGNPQRRTPFPVANGSWLLPYDGRGDTPVGFCIIFDISLTEGEAMILYVPLVRERILRIGSKRLPAQGAFPPS
ncbi:MAG: hypothetical protein ACK41Q_04030 [Candidatus Brocadia sp.]